VHAAAVASFDEAAHWLIVQLTGIAITPRHLQDLTHEIGTELAAARNQRTCTYREQPLNTPPRAASPPMALAVVMVDGGRIQTRQPDSPSGVHAPQWRKTKSAVLLRMNEGAAEKDPHPELPRCFASPSTDQAEAEAEGAPNRRPGGPWPSLRTGLASLGDSERFGWMLAAEADRRGFSSAAKGAYLGNGGFGLGLGPAGDPGPRGGVDGLGINQAEDLGEGGFGRGLAAVEAQRPSQRRRMIAAERSDRFQAPAAGPDGDDDQTKDRREGWNLPLRPTRVGDGGQPFEQGGGRCRQGVPFRGRRVQDAQPGCLAYPDVPSPIIERPSSRFESG
jgi:hypothetical protein